MKALHCPFLTRFPVSQVRQYASELLGVADRCPIMGHVIEKVSTADKQQQQGEYKEDMVGMGVID